jgi:hypothetical protein
MGVVNGVFYPNVRIVKNGESITGSYYKMQVMASGSVVGAAPYSAGAPGHIMALKNAEGADIVAGSMGAGGLFIPPGTIIEMTITSASLDTTSAPIMFWY